MKILLLEDNSIDADLTIRGITGALSGCHIQHAVTLEEATMFLNAGTTFDIALLDMNLPDGNGLEFLMDVRQRDLNFPVIMLTGSGDEDAAVTALKAGADDYIVKRPGYISQLPFIINFAIDNSREKELYKSELIPVLYIEHYPADIDLTVRHFAQYAPNIHIDAVITAEEALSKLEIERTDTAKYKVILIDYHLVGMNALELIKIIRQKKKLCIPIILIAGRGNEELAVQALKLGATDYLTKSEKYLYRLTSVIINSYQYCELKSKQESLRQLSRAVEQSPVLIMITDTRGNIEYVNPKFTETTGYSMQEVLGRNPRFLKSGYTSEAEYRELWNTIVSGSEWKGELQNKRKDGTQYWEDVSITSIKTPEGKITHFLAVKSDITEKKKMIGELIIAKEKAEESDQLKTSFLNNISHEIRTPLNAIVGFTGIMADPLLSPDKRQEFGEIIENSSNQLLSIITDIINISTIEAGQEKLNLKNTDINSCCSLLYEQFSLRAKSRNISFRFDEPLPDSEAFCMLDETKFMQILTNLLDNAFKFNKEGYVHFGYSVKNDFLEFYVKDSGIGIHPDFHREIFKRFRQVEVSATRQYGGSGLGLSIAKAYVELHGGKIRLESELGKGSVFYFTIPCRKEKQDITADVSAGSEFPSGNKKSISILVAEDEDFNYMLIEELLSGSGTSIIRANNGSEALEFVKSTPEIGMVLMDLKMPVMDGYEATRRIKQIRPDLPVIAQTAYSADADKFKAMACGCNDFISKPFKQDLFISKIMKYTGEVKNKGAI
jgi:PAS domain S-box-containing protein